MVKEVVKDKEQLKKKCCLSIVKQDKQIMFDLIDTANTYKDCVGLAANQIGFNKRIIIVWDDNHCGEQRHWIAMFNPVIVNKSYGTHLSEEGCLSLNGTRVIKRHDMIEVLYTSEKGQTMKRKFHGTQSNIVQHEIDHLNGKLI